LKIIIFLALSIPVVFISRRFFFKPSSHGFYRFFCWECIIWLLASNYPYWFVDPLGYKQLVSWFLLVVSCYPAIAGALLLRKASADRSSRHDENLFAFEKTTSIVKEGVYKYIRHPLYVSLIMLTWGIYLKNTTLVLLPFAVLSTVFLFLTARNDEKECVAYFGDAYKEYMKNTRMFIPYIF